MNDLIKTIKAGVSKVKTGVKKFINDPLGTTIEAVQWGFEKIEKLFNPPKPQPKPKPTPKQEVDAKVIAANIKKTFKEGTSSLISKTPTERRETLKSVIKNMSNIRNIGDVNVEFASLDCNGEYHPASNTLFINDDLLQCDNLQIVEELIFTACHEIEHKHQFAVLNAVRNHEPFEQYGYSVEQVMAFAENWENYIDWTEDIEGYIGQPLEVHARLFSELVKEEYERLISNSI